MLLIDAHVHIHDCFDLSMFLEAALANFKAEAIRRKHEDSFTGILLLTETTVQGWFKRLMDYAQNDGKIVGKLGGSWSLRYTNESCSLFIERNDSQGLFIIAGRQVVTRERLEVLALITDRNFQDGSSLEETIQAVRECSSLPAIPWGFGKWMGRRGKILADLLSKASEEDSLFLGDNGGRPGFLSYPFHLKLAKQKNIRVLPGSDPLPFAFEVQRAGSFGFLARGTVSPGYPGRDLKCILLDPKTSILAYGNPERPLRFIRNQLLMQITKHPITQRLVAS